MITNHSVPSDLRQNPNLYCRGSCWEEGPGASPACIWGNQELSAALLGKKLAPEPLPADQNDLGLHGEIVFVPHSNRPVSRRLFQLPGATLKRSSSFPSNSGVCCDAQASLRAEVSVSLHYEWFFRVWWVFIQSFQSTKYLSLTQAVFAEGRVQRIWIWFTLFFFYKGVSTNDVRSQIKTADR